MIKQMKTIKYRLYCSGILVGKIDNGSAKIIDVFNNCFSDCDIAVYERKYRISPSVLIERWEEYQGYIDSSEVEFVTKDGNVYQKNGRIWVARGTPKSVDIITENGKIIGFIAANRDFVSIFVLEGKENKTPLKLYSGIEGTLFAVEDKGVFKVEMHDKTLLSTQVYLPVGKTKVPCILIRTPYGKNNIAGFYLSFVQRGYGLVVQDTRGREDSEGEWIPCKYEKTDGDTTLTWIGESDFCNGSIGMIGASYSGYVQWSAASSGNPYLKAMVSIVTSGSPFIDLPYKGGCLMSGTLAWAFAMSERKFVPEKMMRNDWATLLNQKPIVDIVKKGLGKEVPFWNYWCENDTYNDFWESQSWFDERGGMADIPVLIISGWYDDDSMGTTEAIDLINEKKFSNYKIILGPWLHGGNSTRDINGVSLGKNAIRYDLDYQYLMWFEKHLKGTAINQTKTVEYYNLGENQWKESEKWPPGIKNTSFYIGKELQSTGDFTSYTFNPQNPAPHILDVSSNEASPPGDYQEIERRKDVITFTSNKLTEEISIAGDVLFDFYASSDCVDTDWVVRISDVFPDGRSIKLAENILRAKFRNGFKTCQLLSIGEVYRYQIRSSKIANTFLKGHRIRIMITSGADGYIFPNTNTGKNPAFETDYIIANQKIYHNKQFPSRVILPVV